MPIYQLFSRFIHYHFSGVEDIDKTTIWFTIEEIKATRGLTITRHEPSKREMEGSFKMESSSHLLEGSFNAFYF